MKQTQTQTHPHRPDLRRRAERLISALDDTPAPQTLTDIMRAARTLMVIDRLLTQLWKTPSVKSRRPPAVSQTAPAHDGHSDDTAEPALAAFGAPPLNRHQRRLKAAQERHVRHDSVSHSAKKPVPFPSPHDRAGRPVPTTGKAKPQTVG